MGWRGQVHQREVYGCLAGHLQAEGDGGLGIPDLKLTGFALQTRWLWLQRVDDQRAWSELPLNTVPEVREFFRASTFSVIGNGQRTLFWLDKWVNQRAASDIAPCLMAFVPNRVKRSMTVAEGLTDRAWARSFIGGLSAQAILKYLNLWHLVSGTVLSNERDRLIWRWTADGVYSAKSAYKMMNAGSVHLQGSKRIWKTWAPLKVKIFLWLCFKKRQWTGDRRRRHGLEGRTACYLCDQHEETIDHLLASCPVAREVWFFVLSAFHKQLPVATDSIRDWWERIRVLFSSAQRLGVDSLFALVAWTLWKERNARCFRGAVTPIAEILQTIRAEASLWMQAGAPGLNVLALG